VEKIVGLSDETWSAASQLQTIYAPSSRDYEQLKTEINQWFSPDSLVDLLGDSSDHTSQIAGEWLGGEGKRWRPFLLVSAFMAITGQDAVPDQVKLAAIAVETFHKASLIHDDIQDNDVLRYGKPTVNSMYGIPIALNVGDKLLGDGYKLLSECGVMELVREAAIAHIALCRGQGLELEWYRNPRPLKMDEVIRIIENKTVPAFGVALSFAVICAGGDETLQTVLKKYVYALGIAYQLLDDLDDFQSETDIQLRPTSVFAALCEDCNDKALIDKLISQENIPAWKNANKQLMEQAIIRVKTLAETCKQQALDSLSPLKNVELKRLLFRITKKILK
jgi:geranylgeranyl pyrophosphate synthase